MKHKGRSGVLNLKKWSIVSNIDALLNISDSNIVGITRGFWGIVYEYAKTDAKGGIVGGISGGIGGAVAGAWTGGGAIATGAAGAVGGAVSGAIYASAMKAVSSDEKTTLPGQTVDIDPSQYDRILLNW